MRTRPACALTVVAVSLAVVLLGTALPARASQRAPRASPPAPAGDCGGTMAAPVEGTVVDPFRPPATPYGPGNRGIDYATAPGATVRAAAPGTVVFAGQVGGTLHVVVAHEGGVRTSYSFLAGVSVVAGQVVGRGQPIGRTDGTLHFGVRVGDDYVDPAPLLACGVPFVHLVPHDLGPGSVADPREMAEAALSSRRGLVARIGSAVASGAGLAARGVDALARGAGRLAGAAVDLVAELASLPERLQRIVRLAEHYANELDPLTMLLDTAAVVGAWWGQRDECTAADTADALAARPPGHPDRIVVLVAGLGSSTQAEDGIEKVDVAALGYDPGNVVVFSYNGGREPGTGANLPGLPSSSYGSADSTQDINDAGQALRGLLAAIAHEHPGAVVDILAHSQGGLVARAALVGYEPGDEAMPEVAHLVTIATPHNGSNVATAGDLLTSLPELEAILDRTEALTKRLLGFEHDATSVRQLSEVSDFIGDLNDQPLPAGVDVTSIALRWDVLVTNANAHLGGATNVVVDPKVGPVRSHNDGPGSSAVAREVLLAVNGFSPGCQSLGNMLGDHLASEGVDTAEDLVGVGLTVVLVRAG